MEYEKHWTIEQRPETGWWWIVCHLTRPSKREVKYFVEEFPTATAACAYLETM